MSINYLTLTNRVLKAFNEVPLTSVTFPAATGFHADCQDNVNRAIVDLYTEEDTRWPFAWTEESFDTEIGEQNYDIDVTAIDWESFRLDKPQIDISTLTQVAGVATAHTSGPHYLLVDDVVFIDGANEDDYLGTFSVVSVADSSHFTFAITSSAAASATGTIVCYPPFSERKLGNIAYEQYISQGLLVKDKNNINSASFGVPKYIVRVPDNSVLISGKPDRVYPIVYDGYTIPDKLVLYSDTIEAYDEFEQVIVDKALHYAYMFRDNVEEADKALDRYTKAVNRYRRVYITQDDYMRYD